MESQWLTLSYVGWNSWHWASAHGIDEKKRQEKVMMTSSCMKAWFNPALVHLLLWHIVELQCDALPSRNSDKWTCGNVPLSATHLLLHARDGKVCELPHSAVCQQRVPCCTIFSSCVPVYTALSSFLLTVESIEPKWFFVLPQTALVNKFAASQDSVLSSWFNMGSIWVQYGFNQGSIWVQYGSYLQSEHWIRYKSS